MEPNAYFHSILALNNVGVSLVKRNCFEDAIQVFIDTLNLLGEEKCSLTASALLNKAIHTLENRQKSIRASIDPAFWYMPTTFLSADTLIQHVRSQFRNDLDGSCIEQKEQSVVFLVSFTESIDLDERNSWEAVVAIISSNLGVAHLGVSTKLLNVSNSFWAAHYLWEYSVFLCKKIVYSDKDDGQDWSILARCLQLLLYRCLQKTATFLNIKEQENDDDDDDDDSRTIFGSLVYESLCLWENEVFRIMPSIQTVADAA